MRFLAGPREFTPTTTPSSKGTYVAGRFSKSFIDRDETLKLQTAFDP
jgi:hypothetical protein